MNNKKLLLYLICTEAMLILCIALANLNPTPILYFVFYNSLYGLVFSLCQRQSEIVRKRRRNFVVFRRV